MSKSKPKTKRPTLTEILRDAIADSQLSHYRIWKDTGISQPIITRFVNGERGISLDTADKLLDYFGLEVRPGSKPTPNSKDSKGR